MLRIIDQNNPPSRPQEFRGHDAIAAYFDDVCGRAMTHRADAGVADGDRLAFTQTCTYPDGKQVVCSATLQVADDKIAPADRGSGLGSVARGSRRVDCRIIRPRARR